MATIESATEIRPFHVEVPEEDLVDLRRRIAATRRPEAALTKFLAPYRDGRGTGRDTGSGS